MYVCICNALTDVQVRQAVASADAITASAVYAACGCRAQCGTCAKTLLTLARQACDPGPALLAAD